MTGLQPEPRPARMPVLLGPGVVFALTVIGPGDFVSNTAAGASYGYGLLWALAGAVALRYVWLDASARYVLATGESLLEGYARLGNWVIWVVLGAVILARHIANLYKVVLMGSCLHLLLPLPFAWSSTAWSLLCTLSAFGLMYRGGYAVVERGCKYLIAVLGGSVAVIAVLSRPDPLEIVRGALLPSLPPAQGVYSGLLVLTALIGTEAGGLTNLNYSYFLLEKGWADGSWRRRQRLDLAISVGCIFLTGGLLQTAAAGTLRPLGIVPQSADDLLRIFSEKLGSAGRLVFPLGLWGSCFSGFLGGTTGSSLIAADICRRFVPRWKRDLGAGSARKALRGDPLFRWGVIFWSLSPLYILATRVQPILLVLVVNALYLVLMPMLAVLLLRLSADRARMGDLRNGWFSNSVIGTLALVAGYLSVRNGLELWRSLAR